MTDPSVPPFDPEIPPASTTTPPPAPPPPPAPAYATHATADAPLSESDEKLWAMLAHLGGILIGFLSGLIVMLVFGKRSAFVDDQAKEALNFQITVIIGYVISFVLTFVIIGIFLFFAVAIAAIVFAVLAGIAANKGERYRYPFALRLVK